jgi:hypothetical protein
MSEYHSGEKKTRLDALSQQAEKFGYALLRSHKDPGRLDLISRYPSFVEERERFEQAFYSIEELAAFLENEESTLVATTYWSMEISAPFRDASYESRKYSVVVEAYARRDVHEQELAYEQAIAYVETRPEAVAPAHMNGVPSIVSKPMRSPDGKKPTLAVGFGLRQLDVFVHSPPQS